jgi:WD40 repeat protein
MTSLAGELFSDDWYAVSQVVPRREEPPLPELFSENSISDKPEARGTISTERSSRSFHFFRNAANLGAQVADALEYAHQQGVMHRDIKPSNLILDARGTTWITDFGLARIETSPGLTMTGDMLGTLRYMSPEQMLSKPGIDHRTDIYSLGVTLYELLTLRPAVSGKNRHDFVTQIADGQPHKPRKFNRYIPRELETILFKAMEKDPDQRYATARELADDLRRFVENRPIKARRPNFLDATIKWSRRHSDLAWMTAIFLSIGILAVAAAAIWIAQLNQENNYQRRLANERETIANAARSEAELAREKLRAELYAKNMNLAYTAWRKHWIGEVDRLLQEQVPAEGESDLRGFEWYLLRQLTARKPPVDLIGHNGPVQDIAVFANGTRLASVGNDGTIRIWDLGSYRELFELPTDLASPNGGHVYSAVAVSPDGRQLVTGQTELSLWDLENRRFVRKLMKFPTHVSSIAFSPDGTWVAAHSADQVLKVISLADGQIHEFRTDHGSHRLTFSPDGSRLLAPYKKNGGKDQGISCWDTATWQLIQDYESRSPRALTVSSDGRFLFHGTYYRYVRLIDMANGEVVFDLPRQLSRVADVALSPDDRVLVALFYDGSLAYWHLREGWQADPKNAIDGEITVVPAHNRPSEAVRFIDRNRFATCGDDGLIRIWEVDNSPDKRNGWSSDCEIVFGFANQATEIWSGTKRGIQVLDATTLEPKREITLWSSESDPQAQKITSLTFSDDERYMVCGNGLGTLILWDRHNNRELRRIEQTDVRASAIVDLAISHDGRWLASAGHDHTIRIRSMDDWNEVRRFDAKGLESTVEFSPDGQSLAISDSDGAIKLLETGSWKERARAVAKAPVEQDCLRFSPDGTRIITGHFDAIVRVWDVATMKMVRELNGHSASVTHLAMHPDGKTFASTSSDLTLRLWHLDTFTEIGILNSANVAFWKCCFSPDGSQLVAVAQQVRTDPEFHKYDLVRWQLSRPLAFATGDQTSVLDNAVKTENSNTNRLAD